MVEPYLFHRPNCESAAKLKKNTARLWDTYALDAVSKRYVEEQASCDVEKGGVRVHYKCGWNEAHVPQTRDTEDGADT